LIETMRACGAVLPPLQPLDPLMAAEMKIAETGSQLRV
jgi:hypothetical protein